MKEAKTVIPKLYQSFNLDSKIALVTGSSQGLRLILFIENKISPIDILVNNARIQRRALLELFKEPNWHDFLQTNLTGIFFVSKKVAKLMILRKRGKIINICLLQSELARINIAPYPVTKYGLKMFTKWMTTDWEKYNIQAKDIESKYFSTETNHSLTKNPQFNTWLKARILMERWGDPAELIKTIIFLASLVSDFITGQVVYVDGSILSTIGGNKL